MTTTDETTQARPIPTGLQLTPLDAEYQDDPYAILAEIREREPVHYDAVLRRWFLTRHDDVDSVLRDRGLAVDPRKAAPDTFIQIFLGRPEDTERERSMLFADPPYHTRLRGLVSKAFTPRALEQMTPRIHEIVAELLDAVDGQAEFDLIDAFAGPLPTIVIAEMLGIDPADKADFKRWSDAGVMGFDPMLSAEAKQVVQQANVELDAYLTTTIADRRRAPRADLISSLIAVEDGGDQLTDGEIVTMCALLLAAGNVTTTDLIGNGVLALLQHPDQLDRLRADPALIKNAVEEMLRYDSPVTQTGRIPLEPIEVGGCPIEARQSIITSLAAANHDPAHYNEPERFDITRSDSQHHSFGGGVHYCLGAPLARIEAEIAINALVQRFPQLRLAPGPLDYRRIPAFRGLASLRVLT